MSTDEWDRVRPYFERIDLPVGLTLCRTREPIEQLFFPGDAVTSTIVELPDGEAIEVGLMGAEGIVGIDLLYGVRVSSSTVVVQVPGRGYRIATSDFERVVARNDEFFRLLLRYCRSFFGMVAQSGACNATHPVEQRLARWLLLVHDRVGTDQFPLTHDFIALMLGVRRASVSVAASALRERGAIDYERGIVRVLDRRVLETASCSCYEVIEKLIAETFSPAA